MRVASGLVGAMLLATAAHAAEMSNVNLVCTGYQLYSAGTVTKSSEWKQTYRIDYEAKRWCEGFCRETFPIQNISDEMLILRWNGWNDDNILISRTEARVQGYRKLNSPDMPLVSESFTGKCTVEPFTGLKPIPQF